jgi:hypothetical protein
MFDGGQLKSPQHREFFEKVILAAANDLRRPQCFV